MSSPSVLLGAAPEEVPVLRRIVEEAGVRVTGVLPPDDVPRSGPVLGETDLLLVSPTFLDALEGSGALRKLTGPNAPLLLTATPAELEGSGEDDPRVPSRKAVFADLLRTIGEGGRRVESLSSTLLDQNPAGIVRRRIDGKVTECNQAFARILGFESPSEVLGRVPTEGDLQALKSRLEEESVTSVERAMRRRDGSVVWVLESSSLIADPGTGGVQILSTVIDFSERKDLEERLAGMAYEDPLTGLGNRHFLELRANHALALARRQETPLGILFIDLVGFKRVNDRYGHGVGDRVLREAADRIGSVTREADTVIRLGGDEFVILLTAVEDSDAAEAAGRRILGCFETPFEIPRDPVSLQARVGVALFPEHAGDFETLLERADQAMLSMKERNGGGLQLWEG